MEQPIRTLAIAGAIAGLVAAATSVPAGAQAPKPEASREKCYGIAKKGKNDCGTAKHSCAGQAVADNVPEEWVFVAKGSCEKMGGKTKRPAVKEETRKDSALPVYNN
jgi:uncharacterized membrane protein